METKENSNREIKFRVYIPDHERFCFFRLGDFDYANRYLEMDDYPVQQYTGLKDKNGKEIYEGDIIFKETEICSERGEFEDYIEEDVFMVEFSRGSFGEWTNLNLDSWKVKKFEIIGNVFENSELLNNA